jgi:hypothetical protein
MDEIMAALTAAGCKWPVEMCPCLPGACPVDVADLVPCEPVKPPYDTAERALFDWSGPQA